MPLYNAERYVYKTIKCILNQTYENFELLLIDDCGTDLTMEIVAQIQDSRIRIIHNDKNRGIAYSRNEGLKNATGEYIALMDDDDLAPLDRFEKQVAYLDEHQEIDAVGGRYCVIDENDTICQMAPDALENPKFVKATLMFKDPLGNGSMMFRTGIIRKYGIYFLDDFLGMEDYMFWVEFSKYGTIANLREILLYWRCVNGNETSRILEQKKEMRAEKFFEIQRHAIESYGFRLSENEFQVLKKMFPEEKWGNKATKGELSQLYSILKKMIAQAEMMQLENAEEIKIFCRKYFSKRVEISEIW